MRGRIHWGQARLAPGAHSKDWAEIHQNAVARKYAPHLPIAQVQPQNYEHKRVCESANIAKRHVEQVTGACLGGGVMVGAWAAGRSTILCLYMIRLSILCLYMKLVTFLRGLGQRAEVPVGGGVGAARGVAPVAHGLGGALRVAARGALRLPRSPPVRPPSCAARDSPARGPPAVAHQDVPRAAWALR